MVVAALLERSSQHGPPKAGDTFWAIYVDGSGWSATLAGRVQEALVVSALDGKYIASEEEYLAAEADRCSGEEAVGWGFAVFERQLSGAGDPLDPSMSNGDRLAGRCCGRVAVGEPPHVTDDLAMACSRFLGARQQKNAFAELSGMIQAL